MYRMLAWVGCPLAIVALVWHAFGYISALVFLGQAAIGVILMEAFAYASHYGTTRRILENGRYASFLAAFISLGDDFGGYRHTK